ncbi:DNA-binding response regulator, OmpR family, contains REC and winged-helix (wHTH) domain [Lentzea fradiae]|uniref:DNA-binding response regulator, OmpR family, contains REC and winged-helix (WHTH) domain n=1 Tax=Lentzea fradiae TaxID=200378 RepID=A0A1G7SEU6_9PSEU|nr:response regulator transcription factor [Lentzea fradiae]SDG21523.1 DNA-binding response regulator, OmpR family, contains REC and winged-helix (wHTH) domain [Lentzea fradiae]
MCAHVLVVEDEPRQAELIGRYLAREGHSFVLAGDGRTALDQVRTRLPDLVVLDLMLPGVDGWDVCRAVRADHQDLPVLMISARAAADDKLLGFDLGADDYLAKPYDPRELMARVRVLLRRAGGGPVSRVLRVGELELDPMRHEVRVRGRSVPCTPAEFRILATLAAQPGRVFSRAQVLEGAYGLDGFISERTVDVHVRNLRRKLEEDPAAPAYLVTVYGVGYKLSDGGGEA